MPYINSVPSMCPSYEFDNKGTAETPEQTLVFFPSKPTDEEVDNILSIAKKGVVLTGNAAFGSKSEVVRKVDISNNDNTYYFRLSLPCESKEDFTKDVFPDGKVLIKGVTRTAEKMAYKDSYRSKKSEKLAQILCPPSPFSVSFKLPGPIDPEHLSVDFRIDRTFEGIVKKKRKIVSN